ncbi:MFS transporter, partial [Escherichia coli]|nr:MFS transporter [Escherichia coli]
MAIGQFTLALPADALGIGSLHSFYLGLGLLITGNGLFKPNISTMVGDLYQEGDNRRDGAFTIFYMGINLGALLAG